MTSRLDFTYVFCYADLISAHKCPYLSSTRPTRRSCLHTRSSSTRCVQLLSSTAWHTSSSRIACRLTFDLELSLTHCSAQAAVTRDNGMLCTSNVLTQLQGRMLTLLFRQMDCLYATCRPIMTDCVMAELEKLGPKYRIALKIARDERWERSKCTHKGCAHTFILLRSILPMLNELIFPCTVFMPMTVYLTKSYGTGTYLFLLC